MNDTSSHPPIALITGGSRGLGRSMALHLADRGSDLVITYRSNEAEAHKVAAEITAKGRKALALALDVGDSASFAGFAGTLRSELPRVFGQDKFDHLVNNAGIAGHAPLAQTTEALFDELMRVHLKGPLFLTQALLPLLRDGGRIVNISTGLARFSMPGYGAYAAMKGGVEVLTRYLAKELGPRGIAVNTLAPGAIETDFGGGAVRDNKDLNKMVASMTALGRVGLPDDVGGALAMLLAPENRWITGQRIEVSGGMFL
jgi:NAD(P)-dependent dehydrogenase (short-subunit alcohol dehydrogenase family)